jgi:beta-lactam-binding protein with PASTA domain
MEALPTEQRQAVVNSYVMIRGTTDLPFKVASGTAGSYYPERVAEAVWDNEGAALELYPLVRRHQTEQTRARIDAFIQPEPRLPPPAYAAARQLCRPGPSAAICAFTLGYAIGTGIRKVYMRLDLDVAGPTGVNSVKITQAPQDAPLYAHGGGFDPEFTPSQPQWPVIPARMWGVAINHVGVNLQLGNACQDIRPNPTNVHVSEGLSYGRCYPTVPAHAYWWRPAEIAVIGRASRTLPGDWPTYCILSRGCFEQDWTTLPSWPEVQQALETYLESADGLLQRQIWEHLFTQLPPTGDPRFTDPLAPAPSLPDPMSPDGIYGAVKVPQGIGLTRATYIAALKSLGFDVDVEVRSGFNRDHDADDVLYVNPAQGTRAPAGSTVEIVVNPTEIPVPPPLTTETAEEYAERAYEQGWNPEIESHPDASASEGAITGPISPPPGSTAQPKQKLSIPAKPKQSRQPDADCEGYEDAPNYLAATEAFNREPYRPKETLAAPLESGNAVELRWGRTIAATAIDSGTGQDFINFTGFGWAHITAKHGWGPWARAKALAALASPWTPATNGYHEYRTAYPGRNGKPCVFRVFVDPSPTSSSYYTGPTGIITAYGGTP